MKQAGKKVTPPIANRLIGTLPGETIDNCANVCRFMGDAVDSMQETGCFDEDNSGVVYRIMVMVADVLKSEAEAARGPRFSPEAMS